MFDHNTLQKHLNMMDLLLSHISLCLGKLDPEVIRKTNPRSILTFSKAVGLG